jgi:hypothetical protein
MTRKTMTLRSLFMGASGGGAGAALAPQYRNIGLPIISRTLGR